MNGDPESVVRELFDAVDRLDFERMLSTIGEGAQSVEETSRRWLRSKGEIGEHFKELEAAVTDVRSELRDVHQEVWGDVGIVTCWLEQEYVLAGEQQRISAPSTFVLRREGDRWTIALVHSVPLAEESGE